DWHLRFSISGMERNLLSERAFHRTNASLLRGEVREHRDQLFVPAHSKPENPKRVGPGDSTGVSVQFQSAAKDHAFRAVARLCGDLEAFPRSAAEHRGQA